MYRLCVSETGSLRPSIRGWTYKASGQQRFVEELSSPNFAY